MKAKIRILIRRIKRSYKKDREQWIKGGILTVILLVIVIFAGSCACGKKTVKAPDAESQGRYEDHADPYSNTYAGYLAR